MKISCTKFSVQVNLKYCKFRHNSSPNVQFDVHVSTRISQCSRVCLRCIHHTMSQCSRVCLRCIQHTMSQCLSIYIHWLSIKFARAAFCQVYRRSTAFFSWAEYDSIHDQFLFSWTRMVHAVHGNWCCKWCVICASISATGYTISSISILFIF